MFAIASLLDTDANQKTSEMWHFLMGRCSVLGVLSTPTPHMTWQVSVRYEEKASQILEHISKIIPPITIRCAGVGVFTSENPVLYLTVVKTPEIMKIHTMLWEILQEEAIERNHYYSPEYWVPHITLAYRDVTREMLTCVLGELAYQKLDIEMVIDNFALIYATEDDHGISNRYELLRGKRYS